MTLEEEGKEEDGETLEEGELGETAEAVMHIRWVNIKLQVEEELEEEEELGEMAEAVMPIRWVNIKMEAGEV